MMRFSTLLRLTAALLALLTAGAVPAAPKVIRMFAGGDNMDYTPTPIMTKSEGNPYPHDQLRRLADQWEAGHPGYRIELVTAPPSDLNYRAWCISNFVGGTIPDIIYQNMGVFRDNDFPKGWVEPMDPYLARPNPYVPGNRQWGDQFYKTWIDALRSIDGQCYWIAPDVSGVAIACNMDILSACGVTQLPRTLGEFLECCQKVQDSGAIAYLPIYEWYVDCIMPSVLWADKIGAMDTDRNGIVDQREQTLALNQRIFDPAGPNMAEYLRLIQQMSQYYPRGWNIMDPLYTFKQGKVAFMEAQTLHIKRLSDDPRRKFEMQVIPFPDITRQDSPLGGAPLAGSGIAGYTTTWQVTTQARKRGVLEPAIDWLMFLTAPENCAALVNEIGFTLPGVRDAQAIPMFEPLLTKALADMQRPGYLDWHAFNPMVSYTNELTDNWGRIKQCLTLGTIDRDEAARRAQYWLDLSCQTIQRRYGAQWEAQDKDADVK